MNSWWVPGRIEVLGKHTDYAGGNVLVCAVDRGVRADAEAVGGEGVLAVSTAYADPVTLHPGVEPGLPAGHWGRYVQVVLDRLTQNFGTLGGTRLTVSADLPLASGMSSSAALVVATALAVADRHGFRGSELWERELGADRLRWASYLAAVENGRSYAGLAGHAGVGTLGGSEDHTAMLCGTVGELGQFGFAPATLQRRVQWPPGWSFVVAVSGVAAEKTGAARELYNRASRATAEALARWNAATGRADGSLAEAVRAAPEAPAQIARLVADDDYLAARVDQFVAESERLVPAGAAALAAGDLHRFGEIVAESAVRAIMQLDNQVPQTVALVDTALDLGAQAASPFGAGFGGSVWAMVPESDAEAYATELLRRYQVQFPDDAPAASTLVTHPSGAAYSLG